MRNLFLSLFIITITVNAEAQNIYKTIKDIQYVSQNDSSIYRKERCKLDVYYPTDEKGFKTIVWFHGGGLTEGSKEIPKELCNKGFAVVSPNYRLFPKCKNPDYTNDAAAAVAWVYRNIHEYGGDASKIYVAGHSAGGYLTLMLALDKSYLNNFGVDADSIKGYFPVSGQTATHFTIRKERKMPESIPIVDNYAPLNKARKISTRLVLITGDRKLEMAARYEENLYLKAIMESIGNKGIELYELNGFDHGQIVAPACLLIDKLIK